MKRSSPSISERDPEASADCACTEGKRVSHRAEVTAISGDGNLIAVFFQAARQSLRFGVSEAVTELLGRAGNVDEARERRDTLSGSEEECRTLI